MPRGRGAGCWPATARRTPRHPPGRSADRSSSPRPAPGGLAARRSTGGSPRANRCASTASAPNREATSPRGIVRRTARDSGFPCATTGLRDRCGLTPPGSVRWPVAGSTARTGTVRPCRARRRVPPARRIPLWTADRLCRPGFRPRRRPPRRPAFQRQDFRPEVARRTADRQHQQTGPQHLRTRHQIVHRGGHLFEMAGIARGSAVTTCNSGHRACDSRRRSPLRTPVARADAEHAMTRLASVTAIGAVEGRPPAAAAATAGQSMHQTARTREDTHPPTARTEPKERPRPAWPAAPG